MRKDNTERVTNYASGMGMGSRKWLMVRRHLYCFFKDHFKSLGSPIGSFDCLLLQCVLEFNSFFWVNYVKPWVSECFVYMNYMCLYMWFYDYTVCLNIFVFATNQAAYLIQNLKIILRIRCLLLLLSLLILPWGYSFHWFFREDGREGERQRKTERGREGGKREGH